MLTRMLLREFRCTGCGKLLGKILGIAEIKCSRCKSMETSTKSKKKANNDNG